MAAQRRRQAEARRGGAPEPVEAEETEPVTAGATQPAGAKRRRKRRR